MAISTRDIVPLTQARARLTELCEEVHGTLREKVITRNGESCAALIGAERLDHYHRLEREHIHIGLLDEALKGVADLDSDRLLDLKQLRARHGRR